MHESDLRRVYIPLGTHADGTWTLLGGGVLVIDQPLAWLVTVKSLLERARDRSVAALVGTGEQGTLVDLSDIQAAAGLGWIEHERLDLAACLFPVQGDWGVKGFNESQCAATDLLLPPAPTCALGAPPQTGAGRPTPIVVGGLLSDVRADGMLLTTAPLLPLSQGAPLVLNTGLGTPPLLAGVLTHTVLLPDPDPRIPPLRMAEAVSVREILGLIRSAAGKEQRTKALSTGKSA